MSMLCITLHKPYLVKWSTKERVGSKSPTCPHGLSTTSLYFYHCKVRIQIIRDCTGLGSMDIEVTLPVSPLKNGECSGEMLA